MSEQIPLLLGKAIGQIEALRADHDRHAALAREEFSELRSDLAEIREHVVTHKAEKATRRHIIEGMRWAATILVAALSGHIGSGH